MISRVTSRRTPLHRLTSMRRLRPSPLRDRGSRALLAGCLSTLCAIAASGCGGGPSCDGTVFPGEIDGAPQTLHVAATCSDEIADGSRERPFTTLGEALSAASSGAVILVAADTDYEESLVVDKPVQIVASETDTLPQNVTTWLYPKGKPGLIVAPGVEGVLVRGLGVKGAGGVGMWVSDGASTRLESVMVEQTEPDEDGAFGYGILATEGASLETYRVAVVDAQLVGVYIDRASATLDNLEVEGARKHGGIRLEQAKGEVTISHSRISECGEVGLLVSSSRATITDTAVLLTLVNADSAIGDGIVVTRRMDEAGEYIGEASADIVDSAVSSVPRVGVLFSDGATGSLTGSNVWSNANNVGWGAGVWVQSGAGGEEGVLISKSTVWSNGFIAIGVSGANARIIDNARISETHSQDVFVDGQFQTIGDGIAVVGGSRATITGNEIYSHGRFGVFMDNPLAGTILKGNDIHQNFQFGLVIQHALEGIPEFSDNILMNNGFGGANILGPNEPGLPFRSNFFATP